MSPATGFPLRRSPDCGLTTAPITWRSGPLEPSTVVEVASEYLGAPLASETASRLWTLTRGHALFLHELVVGAVESGRFTMLDGEWVADRGFGTNQRLATAVATRLAELDEKGRERPMSWRWPDGAWPHRCWWTLSATRRSLGPRSVTLSPSTNAVPLSSSSWRIRFTRRRFWPHCRGVESVTCWVGCSRSPPTAPISWSRYSSHPGISTSGAKAEPALLLDGANQALARFNPEVAARLAQAAVDAGVGFEGELALARAECAGDSPEIGEARLNALADRAIDGRERARVAQVYSRHLAFARGDSAQAIEVLSIVARTIAEPRWRHSLESEQTMVMIFAGRLAEGSKLAEQLLTSSVLEPHEKLACFAVAATGNAFNGRTARSVELYRQWRGIVDRSPPDLSVAVPRLTATATAVALSHRGEVDAGLKLLAETKQELERLGEHDHAATIDINRAQVEMLVGRLDSSVIAFESSVDTMRRWDPFRVLAFGLAGLAYVLAIQGRVDASRTVLVEAAALPEPYRRASEIFRYRAMAWHALRTSSRTVALAHLRSAERGRAGGRHVVLRGRRGPRLHPARASRSRAPHSRRHRRWLRSRCRGPPLPTSRPLAPGRRRGRTGPALDRVRGEGLCHRCG